MHARTLELLDARGLADDLVPRGVAVREVAAGAGSTGSNSTSSTRRFPMILIAPQSGTEHLLERVPASWACHRRAPRWSGCARTTTASTSSLRTAVTRTASYVVGCDGAHSTVRGLLGVDFVGKQYETHILLADVRLTDPPERPCSTASTTTAR